MSVAMQPLPTLTRHEDYETGQQSTGNVILLKSAENLTKR